MNTRQLTAMAVAVCGITLCLVGSATSRRTADAQAGQPIVLADYGDDDRHLDARYGRHLVVSYAATQALPACAPLDRDALATTSIRTHPAPTTEIEATANRFISRQIKLCQLSTPVWEIGGGPNPRGTRVIHYQADAERLNVNRHYETRGFWIAVRAATALQDMWGSDFACYAPALWEQDAHGNVFHTFEDVRCYRGDPRDYPPQIVADLHGT